MLTWVDDLAVLMWPWRVKNGIILPPAQRRRRDHRHGHQGDEDEAGYDYDAEPARRDE